MHGDDTSWDFTNWEPGLSKRPVVFQNPSRVDELNLI